MYSDRKRKIAANYLYDIFKNNENLNLLKVGKLSIENEFLPKKNIIIWNETKTSYDYFSKANIQHYDEKSMIFLRHIGIALCKKNNEISLWNEEYVYFKERFLLDIEKQYKKLINQLKIEKEKRKIETEKQRINDISTGIFSPADASFRGIFFNMTYSNWSNKFVNIDNEWNYKLKQGISFIYLKLEEICFITYSLTNTIDKNQRLYLREKFMSFKLITEFKENLNEEDELTMNEILSFANHYKHQTKMEFKLDIAKIEEFLLLLDKLFNLLNDLFIKLKPFYEKAIGVYDEYENISNPLGLTGFEVD